MLSLQKKFSLSMINLSAVMCSLVPLLKSQNPNLPCFYKWLTSELELGAFNCLVDDGATSYVSNIHEIVGHKIFQVVFVLMVVTNFSFLIHISTSEVIPFSQKKCASKLPVQQPGWTNKVDNLAILSITKLRLFIELGLHKMLYQRISPSGPFPLEQHFQYSDELMQNSGKDSLLKQASNQIFYDSNLTVSLILLLDAANNFQFMKNRIYVVDASARSDLTIIFVAGTAPWNSSQQHILLVGDVLTIEVGCFLAKTKLVMERCVHDIGHTDAFIKHRLNISMGIPKVNATLLDVLAMTTVYLYISPAIIVQLFWIVSRHGFAIGGVFMNDFIMLVAKLLKHNNTTYACCFISNIPEYQSEASNPKEPLRVVILLQLIHNLMASDPTCGTFQFKIWDPGGVFFFSMAELKVSWEAVIVFAASIFIANANLEDKVDFEEWSNDTITTKLL